MRAFPFFIIILLVALTGQAQNLPSPLPSPFPLPEPSPGDIPAYVGQEKLVAIEGTWRLDNDYNPDENGNHKYNLRFQRFETQASFRLMRNLPFNLAKEVLLVVRSRMEQDIVVNGILAANQLKVADYLKEAHIEIRQIGGLPVAVIIGAMEISYGQDYPGTMDFQNDVAHAMTDPDQGQVKGFTIALEKDFMGLFNKIEAHFFTSNPDITKGGLSHFDGFAFRVSKSFGPHLETEISVMHKGNAYNPELKPETKISFGGVYRRGIWTLWGEGIKMKNSQAYPLASFGATGGASRIVGPGQINLEATGIKKTVAQYAAGYELFLNRKWAIGPTYRYTSCNGGDAGCLAARGYGQGHSLGVSARFTFGGGEENENPTWINKKAAPAIKKIFTGDKRRFNN